MKKIVAIIGTTLVIAVIAIQLKPPTGLTITEGMQATPGSLTATEAAPATKAGLSSAPVVQAEFVDGCLPLIKVPGATHIPPSEFASLIACGEK